MYILGELFGLPTLWYAFPIAECGTFLVGLSWLLSKLRRIYASMEAEPAGRLSQHE